MVEQEQIKRYRAEFSSDRSALVAQNAVTSNSINDIAINREVVQNTTKEMSCKLDDGWSATSQKSSGRCWLFAMLNLFRPGTMKKINVSQFEFSQNHIFFFDKFERANCFLESIISMSVEGKSVGDRTVDHILGDPIGDGGQWNMAVNIVAKYGLVPKSAFPETQSSSATLRMNGNLKQILRNAAHNIHEIQKSSKSGNGWVDDVPDWLEAARALKEQVMANVWRMLCIHLGTPPETFDFQYRDKSNEFHSRKGLTPVQVSLGGYCSILVYFCGVLFHLG